MFRQGLVLLLLYVVQVTIADYGCPDEQAECDSHCKQQGCLAGYCDLKKLYLFCQCSNCSQDPKKRYRNYGCSVDENKKPPEGQSSTDHLRDIVYGKYLKINMKR